MKLVDTHCHPQFIQYDTDRDDVLKRAFDVGISMIAVGTDLETSRKAIELAQAHEQIWASVGLHPNEELGKEYFQGPYKDFARNSRVVAIGEVGLDYYRTPEEDKKKMQQERFEQQLDLAIELDKPLIIHCRDAHADMLAMLKKAQTDHGTKLRGVIHSFTGTWMEAKRYIELGFYIGLNGIATFSRDYDETVTQLPADRILLETDAPYLTPIPHRGKRNEPSYVAEVAAALAGIRGVSVEEIASTTATNAHTLFGLTVSAGLPKRGAL
jgi:TatD DNase family protein